MMSFRVTVTSHESYLGFFRTRWTKQRRHILLPHLVDESTQGHFGTTVCVYEHKIQTVVPQQGGIGVHLLHGDLNGRAQPQGAEGEGHVPGSLEANDQLVRLRPIGAHIDEGGSA